MHTYRRKKEVFRDLIHFNECIRSICNTGFLILMIDYKQCNLTKYWKFFMGKERNKTTHPPLKNTTTWKWKYSYSLLKNTTMPNCKSILLQVRNLTISTSPWSFWDAWLWFGFFFVCLLSLKTHTCTHTENTENLQKSQPETHSRNGKLEPGDLVWKIWEKLRKEIFNWK